VIDSVTAQDGSPILSAMPLPWASQLSMPEREALEARAVAYQDKHTIRGMFFTSTLECLRRDVGQDAATEAAKEAGIDPDTIGAMKKLPIREFNALRASVAKRLLIKHPSYEAAAVRIGEACVEIFFESVAGRTMMLLAGKNPHRLLTAAPNGYTLAIDDEGKRAYTKTGETSGKFVFEHDLLGPCHEIGTFACAIRMVCGIELKVEVDQKTLLDFDLKLSW
jgi:uncharacterized protein (TIGR02265 family)